MITHHHTGNKQSVVPPVAFPTQSIDRLTKAIELLNRRLTLWYGFWHGLLAGIGSTVGVAAVLYLIYWVLAALDFLPAAESVRQTIKGLINNRTGE